MALSNLIEKHMTENAEHNACFDVLNYLGHGKDPGWWRLAPLLRARLEERYLSGYYLGGQVAIKEQQLPSFMPIVAMNLLFHQFLWGLMPGLFDKEES